MNRTRRNLPPGWRWVKLGKVCDVVGGSTPSTGNSDYWDGDIVWVTPTDLGKLDVQGISSSARRITAAGYQSCGTELLPSGTVVMSSRAPIGHLGIARVPLCTNQGCKSFVPGSEVDSGFLFWTLKRVVPSIQALGSGATFTEVSKSALQEFEIVLPPLVEQKRIAATLNEQIAAVERARAAAQAQLDAANVLPAAHLREVFPQPGQPLPTGWRWARLGDVCRGNGQYGLSVKADPAAPGTPLLRMGNISDGRILWDDLKYVSLSKDEERAYLLQEGDLLFNRTNSAELVGKSAVFDGTRKAAFASYLIRFRLLPDKSDPNFLCRYINSSGGRVFIQQNMARAIGQVNISASTMNNMPIPLPPLAEQKRIAAALNKEIAAAEKLQGDLTAQLDEINSLPGALLRHAFAGAL